MDKSDAQFWDLIAGKMHKELDSSEDILFEKGLEDKQNQILYEKGQKIHQALKEARSLERSDRKSSWISIERYIRMNKIKIYSLNILKYAAILLIAFISGYFIQTINTGKKQQTQYATIEVQYGQTSHLFLFDGTEVWLNSGTKFKYPNQFNLSERDIYLEGEAFFKVAHNKNLPFKVKTGKLEVEVLGTSFNVSAYPGESIQSVMLVEGHVQINDADGKQIGSITPGQIAVKTDGVDGLQVKTTNPYFYTSWKDGKVTFNGETLGEIAKKMERWYNVEINFENERLRTFKFTGTILRNKPIDQTIMAMELLAPIKFKYEINTSEKNRITIVRK